MKSEMLYTPTEIKFVDKAGTFHGYASLFGEVDSANDIVAPGAFAKSLDTFTKDRRFPPLLWQHDVRQPIGVWRTMKEDAKGLFVEGELFVDDIPRAREAYRLLKENVITGLSIGYRTRLSERDKKGSRLLKDVELLEVSIVTFPALDSARVSGVKAEPKTEREFEELLRDAGLSRTEAKAFIAGGFKNIPQRDAAGIVDDLNRLARMMSE